jgi:deoxyribose-phosphate aldolase
MMMLPAWLRWLPEGAGLGSVIEHTLLRPHAGLEEVLRLCAEARGLGCRAVCVHGQWLPTCRTELSGSVVLLVAVADFPEGRSTTVSRVAEVARLADAGADEIDIVACQEALSAGDWAEVGRDLAAVVGAAGRPVKVILETALLSPEAIVIGAAVVRDAGAFAVKTSTGFHPSGGATTDAVRLLRQAAGNRLRVKASGGIRTAEQALRMLEAGANLIGTSAAAQWTGRVGPDAESLGEMLGRLAPPSGLPGH